MQTSTSIQSLSIKSMQPLSEHVASSTDFVAWLYPQAPKGTLRCNQKDLVDFPAGMTLRITTKHYPRVRNSRQNSLQKSRASNSLRLCPAGSPLSIPGGSKSMVKYGAGLLNITSGGQTSQIKMPLDAMVSTVMDSILQHCCSIYWQYAGWRE